MSGDLINGLELYDNENGPISNRPDYFLKVKNKFGKLVGDIIFDAIGTNRPSSNVEEYLYYSGGLSGDLQATIRVTYLTAAKKDIDTVERINP